MSDAIKNGILDLWKQVNRPGIDKLIEFLETSDFFTAPCSTKYHLAVPGGLAQHSLNVYNILLQKVRVDFENILLAGPGGTEISEETLIICALGHDLCKVNYYLEGGEPATGRQLDWALQLLQSNLRRMSRAQIVRLLDAGCLANNEECVYEAPDTLTKENASAIIGWLKDGFRLDIIPEFKKIYSVNDLFPMGHGEKSVSILQDYIPLTNIEKLAIRWHMANFDAGVHFDYPSGYAYRAAVELHPLVTLLFTADLEASNIVEKEK